MLEVENIQVYRGKVLVMKDVSFQIKEGETVFLIGPNGAGKTTCMETISGIVQTSTGRILFLKERIDCVKPHIIARKGLTLVPQGRRLFADQNVLDNLRLGHIVRAKDRDFAKSVEMVFNLFPVLEDRKYQVAGTMSGGEQQMLAIARSLMAKPRLLLCDELSLGLAPLMVDLVFEKLGELRNLGTSMLIVEQFTTKVFKIASRGYLMRLGEIYLQGDTETMLHDKRIRGAYLTE